MSINAVALSGNVGRAPELRQTPSGAYILTFSLAVNERIRKGDEWTDHANWVDCVVFGKRAEGLSKVLEKGMKVCLSGRLRYSSWEKDGSRRSKLEVIAENVDIMQRRDAHQGQQQPPQGQQQTPQGNYAQQQQYAPQNGPQQPYDYQPNDYQPNDYDGYWG